MVYYEPVKVIINAPGLVEIILDMVVWHHDLSNSMITDRGLRFTLKLWSSLYFFLRVKRRFSIAFYLQIDSQTKRHNSMIEAYLRAFVNFK